MDYQPTMWGYDIDPGEGGIIPPLLTVDDFNDLTGDRWAARPDAVAVTLAAVSQAVRNACGWHISPALSCEATISADCSVLVLPSLMVNSIASIKNDGVELPAGSYQWQRRGLVRREPWSAWSSAWGGVVVRFNSGTNSDALLAQVVAQIASNHLAAAPGVREEHVGDEGITYNETASGVSGGVTLLERDLAVLAPYRLPGEVR